MTIDELLRDAERKQRRELEQEARKSVELRARLPSLVRKAVVQERKRIAAELNDRSDLSQREIADVLEQSSAWVSQTVVENRRKSDR